ncbi:hypothetical protein EYF80_007229 [Liparis tanakae]|uniref:Uncharacterized protein n=1 Tax=Liparis tanakae TaxID=230148 RepID=A0A4Z2IXZ6_9TELE|nr:hypothetical protein EYF80_007229 [Liparis tanakae]
MLMRPFCVGQARCKEIGGRTERKNRGKSDGEVGRGVKKREQREEEEDGGCYHIIAPCLYIPPPLIIFGPRSLQSLNHTSPEDSEGTWEGLGFTADSSARRASESHPDRCHCVWKYGDFGRGRER